MAWLEEQAYRRIAVQLCSFPTTKKALDNCTMNSPLQQLIDEVSRLDARTLQQLAVVAIAIALGIAIGYFVARRRSQNVSSQSALASTLIYGVSFPLATCALVWLYRVLPWGSENSGAIIKLAIPVFASLTVIRAVARVLRGMFPASAPAQSLINATSVIVWVGLVFHLSGLLPTVTQELEQIELPIGKTRISALALLQGLALVAVTLLGALWLSAMIESRLMASPINVSMRLLLSRLVRAGLFVLALLLSLAAVGIDLTVLSVFSGALGVGLGLGLQKIAANYVSGFAMLVEGSFRVGDYVKLDNFEGKITQINSRYTVVQAANGRESVIPNETFITQRVEHLSLSDKNVAVTAKLIVEHGTDIDLARQLIANTAAAEARVLKEPAPGVLVSEFLADGIELTVVVWIADPENGQLALRSNINIALLRAFKEHGIRLAQSQRVFQLLSQPA
jgi:small-conductance mechanosensitive channel